MGDKLKGKVAIVTGAGRGIGQGIALAFAQEGARVLVNDPGLALDGARESAAVADEVVKEIQANGGEAVANYEAAGSMEAGERIVQAALDSFGRLDILVTCAGILRDRMIFNMTEEEWDSVINVHLKGTFALTKYACIQFRQQQSGRVVTISSTSGLYGNPGQANYGAAKEGIVGFIRVAARDVGRYGVTVNCIAPSAWTRMTRQGIPDTTRQISAQLHVQTAADVELNLSGRGPEDIAPFVCWLASDAAGNVNGQLFYVTGGIVALMQHPTEVRSIIKRGRWTPEEIAQVFPAALGVDMVNPAPPMPPPNPL